jgi:hypothetical protein
MDTLKAVNVQPFERKKKKEEKRLEDSKAKQNTRQRQVLPHTYCR